MNPGNLYEQLAQYADGELDQVEAAAVETLLAQRPELQADVERWRALRRTARRVLESEVVPSDLGVRVRARLRNAARGRPGLKRWLKIGVPTTAAAAVLILALLVWPLGGAAVPVETAGFARIHRNCAVAHRHDAFGVRGCSPADGWAKIRASGAFPCRLPDLSGGGTYLLDGACACSPVRDLQVVHAYFRTAGEPARAISVFATNRPVKLGVRGVACPACCRGCRAYCGGCDQDVSLLAWREGRHGYVAAGEMSEGELVQVVDGIPVAELNRLDVALRSNPAKAGLR